MSVNYYKDLGLDQTATDVQINQAYRRLALTSHPINKQTGDLQRFHKISEAFEVLKDSKLRKNYDKFGLFMFREGVPQEAASNNNFTAGYSYRGDAFEIFEKFFGLRNPFFSDFSNSFSLQKFSSVLSERKQSVQIPDLLVEVPCSLEELYSGCQKLVVFQKSLLNLDGSYRLEPFDKIIEIQPGTEDLSEIVYESEGNEGQNHVKTDLKFIIKQLEHDTFQRQGNDLVLVKKIHLVTALAAEALDIVTLDKRVLTISFDEIISPRTIKLIQNEGMPNQFKKGKLIVKFHIEFPKFLPDQSKQALIEVLT